MSERLAQDPFTVLSQGRLGSVLFILLGECSVIMSYASVYGGVAHKWSLHSITLPTWIRSMNSVKSASKKVVRSLPEIVGCVGDGVFCCYLECLE